MKNLYYLPLILAIVFLVSCGNLFKKAPQNTTNITSEAVTSKPVEKDSIVEPEKEPVVLKQCDMAMLDKGKLFFYETKTSNTIPYEAETDSVVNCVFTQDGFLYYCVPVDKRIMLRRINLEEVNPQPEQVADWGLNYEKCVTETYGTVSPLMYYAGRRMLGLYHEFSWDGYGFTEQKLYNMDNGQITDWDYETWEESELVYISEDEEQTEENYQYASNADEFAEYLQQEDGQYWFKDGTPVCLTDKIDFTKYVSDPDYYEGTEFEYVSSAPDNSKVLYMAILEWGDFPHGILAISSYDGTFQLPLEDTDCTGFIAKWLDDGSLVYVGEQPLSPDDPDYDVSWHYRTHCIKRVYPDGTTKIISDCGEFQIKPTTVF